MYWNICFLICPTSEFIPKLFCELYFFFHSCNGAYLYRKISTLNVRIISFVNIWIFFFCLQSKIDSTNIILDYIIKGLRHDIIYEHNK